MSRLIDEEVWCISSGDNWETPVLDDDGKVVEEVKRMPTIEPESKWIPVSERLPDQFGWDESYLVTLAWGSVGVMEYKSTGWHNYGSFSPVPIEVVTAWMPLPEAYREENR